MKQDLLDRQLQHFGFNNVVRLPFERMHPTCIYPIVKRWFATTVETRAFMTMTMIFHERRSQDSMFSKKIEITTSDIFGATSCNFGASLPRQDADGALMNWLPVFAVHLPRPCGRKVVVSLNLIP